MATLEQAKLQIEENGADLPVGHPIADGKFHRYGPKKKYWYKLFETVTADGKVLIGGSFGYWQGDNENTQTIAMDWAGVTAEDREKAEAKRKQLEREQAEKDRQAASNAAIRAGQQWAQAIRTGNSPYLERKQITAPGVRFLEDGTVLVPAVVLEPGAQPRLVGLQKIAPDGSKRFNTGAAMKGACCPIGKIGADDSILFISEGYATSRSVAMATDGAVGGYLSFNAGNILLVAQMARALHPNAHVLLIADDDYQLEQRARAWLLDKWKVDGPLLIDGVDRKVMSTDGQEVQILAAWRKDARGVPFIEIDARSGRRFQTGTFTNAGVARSTEAARAIGNASVVVPRFSNRGDEKWTDFNDLHVHESLDAVREQLAAAIMAALNPGADDGAESEAAASSTDDAVDPMYAQALQVVMEHQRASISLVQRHLRIGYNRAARLLEEMERRGAVSAMRADGQRDILATDMPAAAPPPRARAAGAGEENMPDHVWNSEGEPAGDGDDRWQMRFMRSDKGSILPTLANAYLVLENDPNWKGVIAFDEFSSQEMKVRPPPFQNKELGPWTDKDDLRLMLWLQQTYRFAPRPDVLMGAVLLTADQNKFHVVRDYLDSLVWDGKERLATWMIRHLGAEDTEYNRIVACKWPIAAVARIYKPGCKADNVLILEGEQGLNKSTALKVLGGEWFTDAPFRLGDKDAYIVIQGKWIVELAELDSFNKAESTGAKLFFGQYVDRFRPPYGKRAVDVPRMQLFSGTTNSDIYLKDETGNRRYWPVKCTKIDLEQLAIERDQLWAEAAAKFRAGVEWWPTAAERHLFEEQQEERYIGDAYTAIIKQWLVGKTQTTMPEILGDCLKLDTAKWTKPEQQRVGRCIAELGWKRRKSTKVVDGKRDWYYHRPDVAPSASGESEAGDEPF